MASRKKIESPFTPSNLLIGLLFILIIMILNYYLATNSCLDSPGVFGDLFGVSNTLFTGLAFIGVFLSVFYQRDTLNSQKEELQLSRDVFKDQHKTQLIQRFENTFFKMLNLFRDITRETNIKHKNGDQDGFFRLRSQLSNDPTSLDCQKEVFEVFLQPYFNTLINIIEFVDQSKNIDNHAFYFDTIKSSMSISEMILLFYYVKWICPTEIQEEDFYFFANELRLKAIIENHNFFRTLDKSKLFDEKDSSFYNEEAFFGPGDY